MEENLYLQNLVVDNFSVAGGGETVMSGSDPNIKEPTLVPYLYFDPADDARRIKEALRDPSKNAGVLIEILTSRVNAQRQDICQAYKSQYKQDLFQVVKSSYSGKFCKLLKSLLKPTFEYLAQDVYKAMAGLGTDEDVLTEVLCTRSNENIRGVSKAFQDYYEKTIEEELDNEHKVTDHYKEIIGMLLSGCRNEHFEIDPDRARKRAETVFKSETNAWSTETKIFMRLLTHEPYGQLRLIFDEYRKISGQSMEEAVTAEFSGDLRNAMLTIVKCAISRGQYYAELLELLINRIRFDDYSVIRVIVTRSEIDLETIKTEYLKIYHKTLYHQIKINTSGDYRNALLALIGDP